LTRDRTMFPLSSFSPLGTGATGPDSPCFPKGTAPPHSVYVSFHLDRSFFFIVFSLLAQPILFAFNPKVPPLVVVPCFQINFFIVRPYHAFGLQVCPFFPDESRLSSGFFSCSFDQQEAVGTCLFPVLGVPSLSKVVSIFRVF